MPNRLCTVAAQLLLFKFHIWGSSSLPKRKLSAMSLKEKKKSPLRVSQILEVIYFFHSLSISLTLQKQCIPPLSIGDKSPDEVIHVPALLLLQVSTSGTVQIELIVNTWSTQLAQISPSVSLSAVAAQQGCRQATVANCTQGNADLLFLPSKVPRCYLVWEFQTVLAKHPALLIWPT